MQIPPIYLFYTSIRAVDNILSMPQVPYSCKPAITNYTYEASDSEFFSLFSNMARGTVYTVPD